MQNGWIAQNLFVQKKNRRPLHVSPDILITSPSFKNLHDHTSFFQRQSNNRSMRGKYASILGYVYLGKKQHSYEVTLTLLSNGVLKLLFKLFQCFNFFLFFQPWTQTMCWSRSRWLSCSLHSVCTHLMAWNSHSMHWITTG